MQTTASKIILTAVFLIFTSNVVNDSTIVRHCLALFIFIIYALIGDEADYELLNFLGNASSTYSDLHGIYCVLLAMSIYSLLGKIFGKISAWLHKSVTI